MWRRLVPLCLERSGAVPLTVDITISDIGSGEDFLESLLPNVPRVNSLRLTGYQTLEAVAQDLPGFFDSQILNLVSLELRQSVAPVQPFPSDKIPTPPVFRDIQTLKSLHLTQTPIYPALFHITSLVELKLIGYTTPFHPETFVRFLGSHLTLEFVELDIRFTDGPTLARKVSLPHLRHFSVTCSEAVDSKRLLAYITFPRGIRLKVLFTKPGDFPGFESLLPSSLSHIRELLHPISTVKTQWTPPMLQLSGNNSFLSLNALGRHPSPYSDISLFSTSNVHEFHVDIHPNVPTGDFLSRALEQLPALKILVVSRNFPLRSLHILSAEPVLCPSLNTVAFFNCNMSEGLMKELGDVIIKRYDTFATRPYRVVIVNSTATPPNFRAIQQLRKSVPCVQVRVDDRLPDFF